jgi:hypothetical protein
VKRVAELKAAAEVKRVAEEKAAAEARTKPRLSRHPPTDALAPLPSPTSEKDKSANTNNPSSPIRVVTTSSKRKPPALMQVLVLASAKVRSRRVSLYVFVFRQTGSGVGWMHRSEAALQIFCFSCIHALVWSRYPGRGRVSCLLGLYAY